MTTAGDLINKAMRGSGVLGVGQTLQAIDQTDAIATLNQMLSQWHQRRWLVPFLLETSAVCTGAASYSVGPGQALNVGRQSRIEAAFIRQIVPANPTPVDFPLYIIESYEEWSRIGLKTMKASPADSCFFVSGYPNGTLFLWPVPSASYEIHIVTKSFLGVIASLADVLTLPPEYEDAIDWELRARFRSSYRLPQDPYVIGKAKAALATLRKANLQLDRLRIPDQVRRGSNYNILSDQGR